MESFIQLALEIASGHMFFYRKPIALQKLNKFGRNNGRGTFSFPMEAVIVGEQ